MNETSTLEKQVTGNKSSSEYVRDYVINAIRHARYSPGQRLAESDLTHRLKVSRGPVREALKHLAAEGLIELNKNKGAYIHLISRKEMNDLMEVLKRITSFASGLAAQNISSGDNRRIFTDAFKQLEKVFDNGGFEFINARDYFYETLIILSHNNELHRFTPAARIHLLRIQVQPYMKMADRTALINEYKQIYKTVLDGDSKAAEQATYRHLDNQQKRFNTAPDEAFAPGL